MKYSLILFVFLVGSTGFAFAEEGTPKAAESTGNTVATGNSATEAVIDTAEDTGKTMAGSAINQAADAAGDVVGSDAAKMGKDMAATHSKKEIGNIADSARASYGVNNDSAVEDESEDEEETAAE